MKFKKATTSFFDNKTTEHTLVSNKQTQIDYLSKKWNNHFVNSGTEEKTKKNW